MISHDKFFLKIFGKFSCSLPASSFFASSGRNFRPNQLVFFSPIFHAEYYFNLETSKVFFSFFYRFVLLFLIFFPQFFTSTLIGSSKLRLCFPISPFCLDMEEVPKAQQLMSGHRNKKCRITWKWLNIGYPPFFLLENGVSGKYVFVVCFAGLSNRSIFIFHNHKSFFYWK